MLTKTPEPELQATIDGRSLSYQLRHKPPGKRAVWAKKLVTGKTRVDRFTRSQAAAICGVSLPTVNQAVKCDQSRPPRLEPQAILAWWESASFAERVALIHALGPGPTWDALSAVVGD
jgi:hypothetical protein